MIDMEIAVVHVNLDLLETIVSSEVTDDNLCLIIISVILYYSTHYYYNGLLAVLILFMFYKLSEYNTILKYYVAIMLINFYIKKFSVVKFEEASTKDDGECSIE